MLNIIFVDQLQMYRKLSYCVAVQYKIAAAKIVQVGGIAIANKQRCNRVTSIDPDDPLTHWLRPSDLDNDPDVTRF